MVEETETRQHVLFGGLNSCVAAAVNEVGRNTQLRLRRSDLKLNYEGKKE